MRITENEFQQHTSGIPVRLQWVQYSRDNMIVDRVFHGTLVAKPDDQVFTVNVYMSRNSDPR